MVLYINYAIHACGFKFGHAPGVDSLHRLTMGKNSKIFFSETTGPTALIFCMWQWLMVLYINCANHVPGVKFGHAPGVDSLHRLTIGKTKKIFFSETTWPTALIFWYVAMANGPLHKLCHSCPWGQIWPGPGG